MVRRMLRICKHSQGFTLVEMIVVMAVFLIILAIAAQSFNTIVTQASKFTKIEESNIEGVIGLEVMRHDLEQMGFGLPWQFKTNPLSYDESTVAHPSTNDTDSSHNGKPPRAFVGLDGFSNFSSDFIGVKGTTVGSTKASQRWTYIPFRQSFQNLSSRPITWPSNNLQDTVPRDSVIVIRSNFNDPGDDHLLLDSGGIFFSNYYTNGDFVDDFLPATDQQAHMVYGIVNSKNNQPRMPFNRADFFIKVPNSSTTGNSLPLFCGQGTGTLYKATVNHNNTSGTSGGGYNYIPLLDCVADMQVVLGWDTSDGGNANSVDAYSSLPKLSDGSVSATNSAASSIQGWLTDPKGIREHLKMIKVYILAQEGKLDRGYTYPKASIVVGDVDSGEKFLTREYTFTSAQRQYHWKLYRIIVRPKNLVSNQR